MDGGDGRRTGGKARVRARRRWRQAPVTMSPTSGLCRVPRPIARRSPTQADLEDDRVRPGRGAPVTREHGVVYDVGRSMGSLSMNWRPDLTQPLMRRELEHGTT